MLLANIQGDIAVSDFVVLSVAAGFAALSWLLLVLCERLAGGKS